MKLMSDNFYKTWIRYRYFFSSSSMRSMDVERLVAHLLHFLDILDLELQYLPKLPKPRLLKVIGEE